MGIRQPIDFRFPEREASCTQGGSHTITVANTWQTVIDFTNKRGTMYVRNARMGGGNWFSYLRVTIDDVAYPIQNGMKNVGLDAWWIFDFNESVKVEHYAATYTGYLRTEYAYYEYRP